MGNLDDAHPCDWRLHHISLPDGQGDFTSMRRDGHREEHVSLLVLQQQLVIVCGVAA
jgi:hypothetical protein